MTRQLIRLMLPALALAGCGPVNRGLESIHQPVVENGVARVDGCPDWSQPSQPDFAASTMSNYGCATNTNLAAMIADPEDLLRGKSSDATDPAVAAKAIKAWREAPPTGLGGLEKIDSKAGGGQ